MYDHHRRPALYSPDNLLLEPRNTVTDTVTLAAGLVLSRGTLLGQPTGGDSFIQATATATDGSAQPKSWVILAQDMDTSATGWNAPAACPVYLSGEFDAALVTFGDGITAAGAAAALRQAGMRIFLRGALR